MGKLRKNEFYCVKCRDKVKVDHDDICLKKMKNKRRKNGVMYALKSECECGTSLHRFVADDDIEKFKKEYGVC